MSRPLHLCWEIAEGSVGGYPILLEQRSNGLYRVTYGKQVTDNLTYEKACMELGVSIMHSLACEGRMKY